MHRLLCCAALAVLLCFSLPGQALQLRLGGNMPGAAGYGSLKVRITDENDRPIGVRAHVELLTSSGVGTQDQRYCDEQGMVDFNTVPVGTYNVVVSGDGLVRTESGMFEVDTRKTTQSIYIRVKRTADMEANSATTGGGIVSARSLSAPPAAGKEFDRATKAIAEQDWKKAMVHLKKALAIDPEYVDAYNNLGAAYQKLGDPVQAQQSWEKAVSLDGKFAPALLNLGRMSIGDRRYSEAEDFLSRASASDSANPQIFMLLAQSQLLAGHFDQAIASKVKVHSLPKHEKYALAHCIAARALEHENRRPEAVAELQTFLVEQPEGTLADVVRRELTKLNSRVVVPLRPQ